MSDDTATKRLQARSGDEPNDWRAQFQAITGRAFSDAALTEVIYPEDRERVERACADALETGKFLQEFRVRDRHGNTVWVRGHGVRLFVGTEDEWAATIVRIAEPTQRCPVRDLLRFLAPDCDN